MNKFSKFLFVVSSTLCYVLFLVILSYPLVKSIIFTIIWFICVNLLMFLKGKVDEDE